jgi:hypothetical protein
MAKNKQVRSMSLVGAAQHVVEEYSSSKFAATQELVQPKEQFKKSESVNGRINLQLSCTITPDDKELLNELALYACNRERKVLNISTIIRALIRLGDEHKEELRF